MISQLRLLFPGELTITAGNEWKQPRLFRVCVALHCATSHSDGLDPGRFLANTYLYMPQLKSSKKKVVGKSFAIRVLPFPQTILHQQFRWLGNRMN